MVKGRQPDGGKTWQDMARHGKTWQDMARRLATVQDVLPPRKTAARRWQDMADGGKTWQDMARHGKTWQDVLPSFCHHS
jgi:hypothetical protein